MTGKWTAKVTGNHDKPSPPSWTRLELLQRRTLKELRAGQGRTQTDIADNLGVSPPRISHIETAGTEQRISSVERYIAELGGQLKLIAEFENAPPTEILGIIKNKETGNEAEQGSPKGR